MADWQIYIDSGLINHGCIVKAGIYGINTAQDKCILWASHEFEPSDEELITLSKSFIDPETIVANGIFLENEHYICMGTDTFLVHGKRTGFGCVAAKTSKCLVVAVYEAPSKNATHAICVVNQLAEYLKTNAF